MTNIVAGYSNKDYQTMAHSSRDQHLPASYLDGISVKISERYKPPKRITLALSYSQILTLNKLIQEPTPSYDFSLEESIKNRVHEWRKARTTIAEERKQRLHNINQERNKNVWNKTDSNEPTEVLNNKSNSEETNTSNLSNNHNHKDSVATGISQHASPYYSSESGVLIPITVGSTQPITHAKYQIDKGFNFSEFESDTSSPFDNMELKTINDLEELAEVLKTDSSTSVSSQVPSKDQLAVRSVADSNYTNSIPGIDPAYAYALKHNMNAGRDNHINGYYFNHSLFASKLMYGQDTAATAAASQQQLPDLSATSTQGLESSSSVRSVPDIMKSLEAQLAVNHISEPALPPPPPPPSQPAATTVATPSTPKQEPSDGLENPYKSLSSDLQDLVIKISYMGFPLSRVARACQALDGNQKKVNVAQYNIL